MKKTQTYKIMQPSEIFAVNLRGLMAMKNVSPAEMQEYMGISNATYYKRLKRPCEFTLRDMESAAKKLGVHLADMIGGIMTVGAGGGAA